MQPGLQTCHFPTAIGSPKHICVLWILWPAILKSVSKQFLRSPLLFTKIHSNLREAQNQQSWWKRKLYRSLTLPLLLSAIFVFATKDSMPGLFLCFCQCFQNCVPLLFFLCCHPRLLISHKRVFVQVVLWLEDNLFTAGCSAVIIWVSFGLFLIFLFLSLMTTYKQYQYNYMFR